MLNFLLKPTKKNTVAQPTSQPSPSDIAREMARYNAFQQQIANNKRANQAMMANAAEEDARWAGR